jgi:hypothetical protein
VSAPEEIDEDARLVALGRRLAEQAGRGRLLSIARLTGGRNNRVYRLEIENGKPLVLKQYFSNPRDTRDRLGAEWSFISHAWSRGIRAVPEPLVCDATERAGLYSFVEGRKLRGFEVTQAHVDAAIDFVLAVNERPRADLAAASEACFSLNQHLAVIERRIERLATIDPTAPHAKEAQHLVSARLFPAWNALKKLLAAEAAAENRTLNPDEYCLSPSDYGFHNALFDDDGRLTFLDFEYAGMDDPAKLVSDFFCQPEVPVPLAHHTHFIDRLVRGLRLDAAAIKRCRMLLNAYRIKWTCIILNDFVPLDSARRAFASEADRAVRCADQLAKAKLKMAEIEASIS